MYGYLKFLVSQVVDMSGKARKCRWYQSCKVPKVEKCQRAILCNVPQFQSAKCKLLKCQSCKGPEYNVPKYSLFSLFLSGPIHSYRGIQDL